MTDEAGILEDIRIVDLSWGIPGSVATLLLAEAGADVIKVEPPGADPMRASAGFATWNRSKRGVVLDLSTPDGRTDLERLLATADVLVHSLLPADAARLGLDDAALAVRHPALVVAAVSGFPVDHPDAGRPGWDILVQARMGLMDEQAGHRDGPIFLRFPVPSWGATYLVASGILARLLARERTGRGGVAHTSLLQGALVTMTMHWYRAENPSPGLTGGLPKAMKPSLFECGDGVWIHVMASPMALPLMEKTLADLDPDELAAARTDSTASYFGDFAALTLAFKQRPSTEWLEAMWEADMAVLPAQRMGEVFRDEQAIACGYVVDVDDPAWGRTRQAGPPIHTSPPSRVRRPAPRLGEHTEEVLSEANLRADPPQAARDPHAGSEVLRYPLEGLKVLDMGNYLAGPFAAMLLADLGAEVVKLESVAGDFMRGVESAFTGCQRGKRSIAVDLKQPAARPIIEGLAKWADVVHHNLRYPAARRLGIDEEALRPLNPSMVYCHTSSYGPTGPRADWPGYDQLFQAYSGWEVEGGGEGNPPIWHRMGAMDHQNALASLVATLLALYHRQRTGEGQMVRASILGASTLTASETLLLEDDTLAPYPRLDRQQASIAPDYGIRQEGGTWIAMAGEATEEVRLNQRDAFFDSADNRRSRLAVEYPHAEYGRMEQIGAFWWFGDLELKMDLAPPALGEHTDAVLTDLGFDPGAIEELRSGGVIR